MSEPIPERLTYDQLGRLFADLLQAAGPDQVDGLLRTLATTHAATCQTCRTRLRERLANMLACILCPPVAEPELPGPPPVETVLPPLVRGR